MSDKLTQSIAVIPTLVDGESPSAAKFNALGAQVKRGITELEKAVGDLKTQSWPYSSYSDTKLSLPYGRKASSTVGHDNAQSRSLDIASLARLIGPASNLNPRSPTSSTVIVEVVPFNRHEFSLRYVPDVPSAVVFSDALVFDTFQATDSNLQATGDYCVTASGKVFCTTASNGGTVTYTYTANKVHGGNTYQGSTFNVMPDANQITSGGSGIAIGSLTVENRYPLTLPTITHQQSNYANTSATLETSDANEGIQIVLPQVITENFLPNEALPEGFIFLKNFSTNEIYENAVFYYSSPTVILVGGVDLSDVITAGQSLQLLSVGTDITSSIDDLRIKQNHSHNRTFGEPFVDVNGISGIIKTPNNSGPYVPSDIANNFAPQYLHRDGWRSGKDQNFNDANAMRGNLMLANAVAPQGARTNVTGETFGVYFGSPDALIRRTSADNLRVQTTGAASDIEIISGSDIDIEADTSVNLTSDFRINLDAGTGALNRIASNTIHTFPAGIKSEEISDAVKIFYKQTTFTLAPGQIDIILDPMASSPSDRSIIVGVQALIEIPALANPFDPGSGNTAWVGPASSGAYAYSVGTTQLYENSDAVGLQFGLSFAAGGTFNIKLVIWYV
jgi:hypothetical protein